MFDGFQKIVRSRAFRTLLLPFLVLLLLTIVVFSLYLNIVENEKVEIRTATEITTEQAARRLESWVAARINALWQITDRIPPLHNGDEKPFFIAAETIVNRHSGLLALNWVNKDLVIKIVVPKAGNENAQGKSLENHPDSGVRLALEQVLSTREFVATTPVELYQGGKGVATYLPMYKQDGEFLGLINGVFRLKDMVDAALPEPELRADYALALVDEFGEAQVKRGNINLNHPTLFTSSFPVRLFKQQWTLFLEPYPNFIEKSEGKGEFLFLVLGLTFSLAIAVFLHVLLLRQDLLQEKESRYRSLFEGSRDAIYLSRLDGTFIDANEAFLDLFGYSANELAKLHVRGLYHRENDREKLLVALTDKGYVRDFPVTLKKRDGQTISCLITASLYEVRQGAFEGIQGIIRDITDRLELEQKVHQSQKMEALGRLAGGISHDFNNLLTAMFGQVELMRSVLEPSSSALPYLQDIQDTSERAAELTRRLLAFSRKQPVKPRLIHLVDAIRSTEKLLHRLIGEDVQLTMDLCPPCQPVKADPVQIEQILINLAVNARDAMPNGGVLKISTECIAVDGRKVKRGGEIPRISIIRMMVSDTGTGIPEDVMPHIFEPYFTTKPETEGTGMGLATVFGIVDQLGGHLEVESYVGQGTTFTIDFPTTNDEMSDLAESSNGRGTYKGRGVILVVEDDEGVRLTTQELLRNLGYQVEVAATPEEGISRFTRREGQVDLLLSDVVMPGMSGPEMVEELRKKYPDLRVLFMSGHTPQEFQRRGLLKPQDEILQKPFTVRELAEKIHERMV